MIGGDREKRPAQDEHRQGWGELRDPMTKLCQTEKNNYTNNPNIHINPEFIASANATIVGLHPKASPKNNGSYL